MKTSKSMRLASVLFIMTMISMYIYSGTLAKYISSDSVTDTARVAKWGMEVQVSGSLFGENYDSVTVEENSNQMCAAANGNVDTSVAGEDIVAPGTRNDMGMTFSIKGQPEVTTYISSEFGKYETIWLRGNTANPVTYGLLNPVNITESSDITKYYVENDSGYSKAKSSDPRTGIFYELVDTVTITSDTLEESNDGAYYFPIKWTISPEVIIFGEKPRLTTTDSLYVCLAYVLGDYLEPGDSVEKTYTITWEWPYNESEVKNGADTILGYLMAAEKLEGELWRVVKNTNDSDIWKNVKGVKELAENESRTNADYSLECEFEFSIVATQVD